MNLSEIAARLDNEQKLKLKYRSPVTVGEGREWVIRVDRLLDVAEDRGILYVERDGEPVWVKLEEAIQVIPESTDDDKAAGQ